MKASFQKHYLTFKRPAGTSRGVLKQKRTYLLQIEDGDKKGIGECNLFQGLSYDDRPDYEEQLTWLCEHIHLDADEIRKALIEYPSLLFGYEQAVINLHHEKDIYFPSDFTENKDSILINGLIWMGAPNYMKEQLEHKIEEGFRCIKIKIGALDWEEEKKIIQGLRHDFSVSEIEIRVDANGAYSPDKAKKVLEELAALDIHSIEQPIKAGQKEAMAQLCEKTPLPIALDEELIGVLKREEKLRLLEQIKPQYIILKPSLLGGYQASAEWISLAESLSCGWWITSALESNIGLNAIAQWTYTLNSSMPQGLGTGELFEENFPSPIYRKGEQLYFRK